ncbi:hypothetical protein KC327_g11264 [Hortaea werneckii]|nr:hypothetical protein KC327_g11264 [Hortaea werneckii]
MEAAGSAVGVASLGIQICEGLLSYVNSWKDYGYDVSEARESISDLHDTLVLLGDNLKRGDLNDKRASRVISCVRSCNDGLLDLGKKLDELQKYSKPEGLRQKACAELQRTVYPFRKDTLAKLRGNVADVRERLGLAIQVLQLSVQQSDRWRKIVDWLSPPDPWTNHRSARDRHEPHTGEWLLQNATYWNWKAGKTRHLWICGKAGCGKTVLSSTLIEDIKQLCDADENLGRFGLGAFYFTFSDKQKQSYEDLLRSLVEQLAWKQDGFARLQQAYENPNRGRPGRDELEKILLLSLRAYDQVFLALDALDESPEENDTRQWMLQRVEHLVQNVSNVKVLATSREVRDVQETMAMLKAERINVADSKVDKDIRKYVVSELSRDRRLSRLSSKTTSLIEDTLSARADGMFRWAYCQIQELKRLKSTKPKYIEDVLQTLPATLDETYERILGAIEDRYRAEALTLLRWITYSKSPLTLGLSSNCVPRHSNESLIDHSALGFSRHSKVRLAHFSVKEYLESKRISESRAKEFHLDTASEHRFLAQSCMTYVMHYSNDETKLSTLHDQCAYPLLKYSAKSWYHHSYLQCDGDLEREIRILTVTDIKRYWLLHDDKNEHCVEEPSFNDFEPGGATYFASYLGLPKVVEELLARGADVNARGGKYGNALQAASFMGHIHLAELLLARGADISAQGGMYNNALQAASSIGHKDLVELLLAKGMDINAQGGLCGTALQAASRKGYLGLVGLVLERGANVNAAGGFHGSALQAACFNGYLGLVELLLKKGADVNAKGGECGSALEAASVRGHNEIVELLIKRGANPIAPEGHCGNAVLAASLESFTEVVEMLVAIGADVNMQEAHFSNARKAASVMGYSDLNELLMSRGADSDAPGGRCGNALRMARAAGDIETAKVPQIARAEP